MEEQAFYNEVKLYLEGQLSPEAQRALEARLAVDPDLMLEFNLYKGLWLSRKKEQEDAAMLQKLQAQSQELLHLKHEPVSDPEFQLDDIPTIQAPFWKTTFGRLAIAAGFALIVAMIWFVNRDGRSEAEKLAAGYYKRAESTGLLGGGKRTLDEAYSRYQAKEYAQALRLLKDAAVDSSSLNQTYFLKGSCEFEAADYPSAIQSFQQVNSSSLLYPVAQKNIALAWLAQKHPVEASGQLSRMLADPLLNSQTKDSLGALLKKVEQLK